MQQAARCLLVDADRAADVRGGPAVDVAQHDRALLVGRQIADSRPRLVDGVPESIAKYTPSSAAATRYQPTFGLSPPTVTEPASATSARMTTPRRLHRSARMPDGTSNSGTTKVMNSFSTGTQSATFCRNAAVYSGRRRPTAPVRPGGAVTPGVGVTPGR